MTALLQHLLSLPGWVVLLTAGLLVLVEDALFVGFVVPGETAALLAGVASSRGHLSVALAVGVVVVAAVVGDSIGYEVGRHFGPRVLAWRRLDAHRDRLDRAQALLARRGGSAVFLGRFVAFFRAVMPVLAGTARMPYRSFLTFNALGGLVWGAGAVLVGYLAGASYEKVAHAVGQGSAVVLVVLVAAALLVHRVRRGRLRPEGGVRP